MIPSLDHVQHAADKKSLPASFVIILALRQQSCVFFLADGQTLFIGGLRVLGEGICVFTRQANEMYEGTSIEPNVVKMRMPSSKTVLYMVKRGYS